MESPPKDAGTGAESYTTAPDLEAVAIRVRLRRVEVQVSGVDSRAADFTGDVKQS